MMNNRPSAVIEVGERDFQSQVIEGSRRLPVLVDFWAEWCAPCRMLGPMLEKMAEEFKGAFVLAKVDTEASPRLAQAFQIRSIPFVVMFKDGQPVDQFVGALPEEELRQFIQRHCRTQDDDLVESGRKRLEAGLYDEAEKLFRRVLESQPGQPGALLGLAETAFSRGDLDSAEESLRAIVPDEETIEGVDRLRARLFFRRECAELGGPELSVAVPLDDSAGLEERYVRAICLIDAGKSEEAFELLLEIVRRDRSFRDDGARKALVEGFKLAGVRSPLSDRYRKRLSSLLF